MRSLFVLMAVAAWAMTACGSPSSSRSTPTAVRAKSPESFDYIRKTEVAAKDAAATPTIPERLTSPKTLMFCVPLQVAAHEGPGQPVASVPHGLRVVYKTGGCDPGVDSTGAISVQDGDGKVHRVVPEYAVYAGAGDGIVWTPALADLNGEQAVVTAKYLKHDATLDKDPLGYPVLRWSTTPEGSRVFGALTRRIGSETGGLPVAMFLDGAPLRGGDGKILAPIVRGEITTEGQTTGLFTVDAQRLAGLLNSGMLQ